MAKKAEEEKEVSSLISAVRMFPTGRIVSVMLMFCVGVTFADPKTATISNSPATITVLTVSNQVQADLLEPDKGMRFFAVEVVVDNTKGTDDIDGVSMLSSVFFLQDSQGYKYPINAMTAGLAKPAFPAAVAAGDKTRGWITFEIKQSDAAGDLSLRYEKTNALGLAPPLRSRWVSLAGLPESSELGTSEDTSNGDDN